VVRIVRWSTGEEKLVPGQLTGTGGLRNQPAKDCEKSKLQSDKREHEDADWSKLELGWRNRRTRHDTPVDSNCGLLIHCPCADGCTHACDEEHKEYYDSHHSCQMVASADFRVVQVSNFSFTVAVSDLRVNLINGL